MKKTQKSAAMSFIFITILIDITGWGIIIPVIPKLIEELIHGSVSEAAIYGGWISVAYAFTQFVFSPIVGNLSDQFGRRPIILISLFGFSIDYIFLALAPTITWLFIGRIIAGITGASVSTASAYIADISTDENRAKNFGMVGAAFGIGFIIGPVMGGLLGQYGARVPFYAAAILCMINFIYGYFILPESLDKDKRRKFDWRRANPVGSFKFLKRNPQISSLVVTLVLLYIAGHAVQTNWTYFTMYKFSWTEKTVGLSLGVIGLLVGAVQGGLVRWLNPKIGNERSIYYGLILYALGMALFAFATESWMMFLFLIPYCLGGIAGPALQAVITGSVAKNEQGELQGVLTSLVSATAIVGPFLMTQIFFYFTHDQAPFQFSGAPFLLASLLLVASIYFVHKAFIKNKIRE